MSTPWERITWQKSDHVFARIAVRPVARFVHVEAAGGLALVAAALVGLIWVNVAEASYHGFWGTHLAVDLSIVHLNLTLTEWVNDLLMAFFFLVVSLEIKREFAHGELSDRRRAALPVAAAAGGMIVPVLIYVGFNAGGAGIDGWAIPVATDIAFALGVLSLLGKRVPLSLKIFLLALAVADDVGGIVVIAVFFTEDINVVAAGIALALLALVFVMHRVQIRAIGAPFVVGAALWIATHESGVHATIAGVAMGLAAPAGAPYARERFLESLARLRERFEEGMALDDKKESHDQTAAALNDIEELARETESPLDRVVHMLLPWTSFVIVPIFAMANADIELGGSALPDAVGSSVFWGAGVGLVVGKLVGITGAAFLAVRLGLAARPRGVSWLQISGVALLGGIGFTVAIFLANLSFEADQLVANAKIGIFAASLVAAVLGYTLLRLTLGDQEPDQSEADSAAARAT